MLPTIATERRKFSSRFLDPVFNRMAKTLPRSSKMVVLIGVFRLTKAAVLLVVGLGALFGVKWPVIAALASTADASGFFWARAS